MSKLVNAAMAGVVVVAMWVGPVLAPALAQSPPAANGAAVQAAYDEMNCIYDGLSDDDEALIFDNYFDPIDEEVEEIDALMEKLHTSCGAKFKWNDSQHDLADAIALHGAVVDIAIVDLMDAGLKDGQALFKVWDALPDADLSLFGDAAWYNDKAFNDRLKALVLAAGVPSDVMSIENALAVLESTTLASAAQDIWLTQKGL